MPNKDLLLSFKPEIANSFCSREYDSDCNIIKSGFCKFKLSSNIYLCLLNHILAPMWLQRVVICFEMVMFIITPSIHGRTGNTYLRRNETIDSSGFVLYFLKDEDHKRSNINLNNSEFVLLFLK